MKTILGLSFVIALLFLAACSEQADLIIYNRSDSGIGVITDGEKELPIPPNGNLKIKFPGNPASLRIVTHNGQKTYALGHFPPREYRGSKYPYAVTVDLRGDFAFYICYPDGREASHQPDGFPIIPSGD